MARPKKTGLDYFPLDCNAGIDDEIELIEAEYGLEGFAIYIKLLQKIYKSGYYIEWTEKEQLQFSKRVNVDINRVNACIMTFTKWGLMNKSIFEEYQVLTSKGIQKRFLLAIDKRTSCEMYKEYLLLEEIEVNAYKNLVIVCKTHHNADINPQSKVKKIESKEKESKVVSESAALISKTIENAFGRLANPLEVDTLVIYLEEGIEINLIKKALEEAALNGARNLKYVQRIINRCLEEKIYTLERYLIAQEEFKAKRHTNTHDEKEPSTDAMKRFLEGE
ncbi:Lin1244/Lin1753 domain-containing protein [Niameybacter massiliensis]|uniref:Lin1244/Lin1753 domain-containing protein n=1 Tax=Niameybacter massiliensis TaxID=1658108 RepID=UPI0006B4BE41|nr:Lin1244/Lin1753 domain-containing protein [Niameybacter massiliensis]